MRIAGIIAEYDPFHNGHKAHITATRAKSGGNATHVVAVISGSFTQRGEPALLSKFRRADIALTCGADLVLETPLPWAMAPAESFAAGGVAALNALGCVDLLSFGSECGDITALQSVAQLTDNANYKHKLKAAMAGGIPYAAAMQSTAAEILGEQQAALLASPNNTLGIEYLRATASQGAKWQSFTLQRQGALHTDTVPKDAFASASLLRTWIRNDNHDKASAYMPEESYAVLDSAYKNGDIALFPHRLEQALLAHLRRLQPGDFTSLPWVSEGLENRLYRASRDATDYTELLNSVKTRRYPMARLRRVLWASLIGLTTADTEGLPPYIRVLGMNSRGREILSAASPTLPILSRTAQIAELDLRAQRIFSLECTATDLHALAMTTPQPCGADHTTKMILK